MCSLAPRASCAHPFSARASPFSAASSHLSPAFALHRLSPPCPSRFLPVLLQLGSLSVGIRTSQGVVIGVEKRIPSPLLEQSSVEKILEIDRHIGTAVSGHAADARTLVDHARVECANHHFTYDEPLRVESLTQVRAPVA